MSASRLGGPPARVTAPVRHVHLGLGNFFRAHQAWYTHHSPDAERWGIAAFGGRHGSLAAALTAQQGLYTLVTRGPEHDRCEVVASISSAHGGAEHDVWLDLVASPDIGVVTLTVTEAGYCRAPGGGLDLDDPALVADLAALRKDPASHVRTVPARLVAGLAARRRAGSGPLAVVPCDNLADNGTVTREVLQSAAEVVDPALADWLDDSVSIVTTMVDRITPRATEADAAAVTAATGWVDAAPVVTEPFSEWVLGGDFPAGRPAWHEAGATFVDDVAPFERRKLWLLNGGHSLLAYLGSVRGHLTVAAAVADETCRTWLTQWWSEAARHLDQSPADVAAYTAALLQRFENPRKQHLLAQIAADGSQKLPARVVPVLRAERSSGRLPSGAVVVLAAWLVHVRRAAGCDGATGVPGCPMVDVRADVLVPLATGPLDRAVRRVLAALDPHIADDEAVVAAVASAAAGIAGGGAP